MFGRGRKKEKAYALALRQAICFEAAQQSRAIEFQIAKVVLAWPLLRCAARVKDGPRLFMRKARERCMLECARGHRGEVFPICKQGRADTGLLAIALINRVVLELMFEKFERERIEGEFVEPCEVGVSDEIVDRGS